MVMVLPMQLEEDRALPTTTTTTLVAQKSSRVSVVLVTLATHVLWTLPFSACLTYLSLPSTSSVSLYIEIGMLHSQDKLT